MEGGINMFLKHLVNLMKEKQEKKIKKVATKRTAVGLGIGAVVGTVCGLLFAPKEGKETRRDIADGAKKAANDAKKVAGDARVRVEGSYDCLKTKLTNFRAKKDDDGCSCGCGEHSEDNLSERVTGATESHQVIEKEEEKNKKLK